MDDSPSMRLSADKRSAIEQWVLVFAAWTFLAVFSSAQSAVYFLQRGQPIVWREMLSYRFADWYTCALFTPLFFWLAHRYPIDRRTLRTSVPLVAAGTTTSVVVYHSPPVPRDRFTGSCR